MAAIPAEIGQDQLDQEQDAIEELVPSQLGTKE